MPPKKKQPAVEESKGDDTVTATDAQPKKTKQPKGAKAQGTKKTSGRGTSRRAADSSEEDDDDIDFADFISSDNEEESTKPSSRAAKKKTTTNKVLKTEAT